MLVAIVEAATGEDFQAFAQRELFERVGIERVDWSRDRDGSGPTQGSAFLDVSPIAWARLGHLLLNEGRWGNDQLLSADYVSRGSAGTDANPAYAFLWWVNSGDWKVDSGFPTYEESDGRQWPGLRPDYAWRFQRLLMHSVLGVDVDDPGPWTYDGPNPPADITNIEPSLPPFEWQLPPRLSSAPGGL